MLRRKQITASEYARRLGVDLAQDGSRAGIAGAPERPGGFQIDNSERDDHLANKMG